MALTGCNSQTDAQGRELTAHGTAPFPAACYYDRLAQETVPWHWHEEWEAVAVERGAALFSAGGQRYTLQAGEGIFINASVLHAVQQQEGSDCRLFSAVFHPRLVGAGIESVFWQSYVQPVLSNTGLQAVRFVPGVPWNTEAIAAIRQAWRACAEEPPGYELQVRAALSQLVFLLARHCPAQQPQTCARARRSDARIKLMLQYIQQHYPEELTAADIAQSAAVSESECLRCFREILGTTPIRYLRQLRIRQAAGLLASTGLPVAEIGAMCGFGETSYFSRCFREAMGCTPKEYRHKA